MVVDDSAPVDAWMKWYPKDYFSSNARMELSDSGRLAYLELLWIAWCNPACGVKSEPSRLARLTMTSEAAVTEALARFIAHPDVPGLLTNARLLTEWKAARGRVDSGRAAARKRWGSNAGAYANPYADDDARRDAGGYAPPHAEPHAGSMGAQDSGLRTQDSGDQDSGLRTQGGRSAPKAPPRPRRATRSPIDFELTEELRDFATAKGVVDVDGEWEKFRDHEFKPPGHTDWPATWRRWCRRAVEISKRDRVAPHRGGGNMTAAEKTMDSIRRVGAEILGEDAAEVLHGDR